MLVDSHAANCFVNIVLIGIIPFSVTRFGEKLLFGSILNAWAFFGGGVAIVWATFNLPFFYIFT
jgi:hypothetical protein